MSSAIAIKAAIKQTPSGTAIPTATAVTFEPLTTEVAEGIKVIVAVAVAEVPLEDEAEPEEADEVPP